MKTTKNNSQQLHTDALNAITAHDCASTVLSPTQFADGLVWLLSEFRKDMAPFAVRKEYEAKSALCRMFQISNYTADKVLSRNRIHCKLTSNGYKRYNVAEFELALAALA